MKQMTKRLIPVLALAIALPLAGLSIAPAYANVAHHPAAKTTKAKKIKKPAKKAKSSGMQMMNCSMMGKSAKRGGMKCRMGSTKMHRMHSKMHGAGQH